MAKTFKDFVKEAAETIDQPRAGDTLAINIREECLLESTVAEVVNDRVVLEADDRMMAMLAEYGMLDELSSGKRDAYSRAAQRDMARHSAAAKTFRHLYGPADWRAQEHERESDRRERGLARAHRKTDEGDISQLTKDIADAPVKPIASMEEAVDPRLQAMVGKEYYVKSAGRRGHVERVSPDHRNALVVQFDDGDMDVVHFTDLEQDNPNVMRQFIDRMKSPLADRPVKIREGKMKDLAMDLKELSEAEFKTKYGKTKAEMRASLKESQHMLSEREIDIDGFRFDVDGVIEELRAWFDHLDSGEYLGDTTVEDIEHALTTGSPDARALWQRMQDLPQQQFRRVVMQIVNHAYKAETDEYNRAEQDDQGGIGVDDVREGIKDRIRAINYDRLARRTMKQADKHMDHTMDMDIDWASDERIDRDEEWGQLYDKSRNRKAKASTIRAIDKAMREDKDDDSDGNPYEMGYRAAALYHRSKNANPFEFDDPRHADWEDGWREGAAEEGLDEASCMQEDRISMAGGLSRDLMHWYRPQMLQALEQHGIETVMDTIAGVAEQHADAEEMGTSDRHNLCRQTLEQLGIGPAAVRNELGGLEIDEAEYQGRKVALGKPMQGDVKKFKVYVKDPATGNIKKVNFGDPNMRIKKSNPARRRSFRARHNCANPGPRTKARYWSCRKW